MLKNVVQHGDRDERFAIKSVPHDVPKLGFQKCPLKVLVPYV